MEILPSTLAEIDEVTERVRRDSVIREYGYKITPGLVSKVIDYFLEVRTEWEKEEDERRPTK